MHKSVSDNEPVAIFIFIEVMFMQVRFYVSLLTLNNSIVAKPHCLFQTHILSEHTWGCLGCFQLLCKSFRASVSLLVTHLCYLLHQLRFFHCTYYGHNEPWTVRKTLLYSRFEELLIYYLKNRHILDFLPLKGYKAGFMFCPYVQIIFTMKTVAFWRKIKLNVEAIKNVEENCYEKIYIYIETHTRCSAQ